MSRSRKRRLTLLESVLEIVKPITRGREFGYLRRVRRPLLAAFALFILLLNSSPAAASERVDVNATGVRLAVNAAGTGLVTYRARGRTFHLLVWGAVNARPPSQTVRQGDFPFHSGGGVGGAKHPLL